MLKELTLFGEVDRVQVAIDRLRQFEPAEGYYLAFSGGKDSQTIYELAKMAGVKFDAHYNLTTVDPPELIYFIRDHYPNVQMHRPRETMWQLIARKAFPPTRIQRYCCQELKEAGGRGRVVLTGVRWAESVRRSKRKMTESCLRDGSKVYVHPVIDWGVNDVWAFLNQVSRVPHCILYDQGWNRIGCVGCPMATKQIAELERYPKIRDAYIRAFDRMLKERLRRGLPMLFGSQSGEDVMHWWTGNSQKSVGKGQLMMLE